MMHSRYPELHTVQLLPWVTQCTALAWVNARKDLLPWITVYSFYPELSSVQLFNLNNLVHSYYPEYPSVQPMPWVTQLTAIILSYAVRSF